MLGLQFSNNNLANMFNSTQVFGALKQSSTNVMGNGSFVNKRKRSRDVNFGDAQPRKNRKTAFQGFAGVEKTAKMPVASFLQPLPAKTVTVAQDEITTKALCKATKQIGSLTKRIRHLEEQSQYWRRKSLSLGNQNSLLQTEVNKLKSTVSNLESQRLALQTMLMRAESDSEAVVNEIQSLLAQNVDLKSAVNELNEEIAMLADVDSSAMEGDVSEIEQALGDTLADLTDKIDEIADLKKALALVSREKSELDEVVTRQTLLSEMVTLSDDDDQILVDTQGSQELAKIVKLQGAVEKCMFRIALLSEKNEEYKTIIRMARDGNRPPTAPDAPSMLHTLQNDQKVVVLESMCMQRYRTLLRDAAESLVGVEIPSNMDESF